MSTVKEKRPCRPQPKRGHGQLKQDDSNADMPPPRSNHRPYASGDMSDNDVNNRPNKRPCVSHSADETTTSSCRSHSPTTMFGNLSLFMNVDVASEIFSFLDIRSLYNVTMTSQQGMALLRHEHVVRSAMMQGGHSKTCMERLVALIEKRCIWIPSPIRMLRLVNGKTCERCHRGKVHLVSEHYGVFFCFHGCIQDSSTKGVAFNQKWTPYLVDQPRIAKSAYSSSAYLWIQPFVSNERCGPLISMMEIEQHVMMGNRTVDSLLEEKDASDPHVHAVPDILRVFKETTEAADRRIRETKQKKLQASVDANKRRKKKIVAMISSLTVELGHVPWKDVVLQYEWRKSNSKDIPYFCCNLTNELMREYGNAPSKASKKKLKGVADSLRQSFAVLESKGFHNFSFLSDADPVERAVKQYCQENCGGYKLLLSKTLNDDLIERIRVARGEDVFKEFLALIPETLGKVLGPAIVSSTVAIQSEDLREKAITQACVLAAGTLGMLGWSRPVTRGLQGAVTLATGADSSNRPATLTPRQLYDACLEKFPTLFRNTVDFLNSPETLAWKAEHGVGYGHYRDPEAATERLEFLLNQIWSLPLNTTLQPLLNRDFKAVLHVIWDREMAFLHRFNFF